MGDDDGVVVGVTIDEDRDGDGLDGVPGRGAEGQGTGDGEQTSNIGRRFHGDIAGGHGGQHHGVGVIGGGAFQHSQGRRVEVDARDPADRHGKVQSGGVGIGRVGVGIRDGIGQGDGRGHRHGRAGQGTVALGEGQAVGDGAGQGVGQGGAIAPGGFGQRQRRDGIADNVELVGHRGRAEVRRIVLVVDGDGHVPAVGDGAVAGDGMSDDDGVVVGVTIDEGRDDDGLGHGPSRGGEGQGTGDGYPVSVIGSRGHDDGAGGGSIQHHRVVGRGTLIQDEVILGDGHARHRLGHRHGKGQAGRITVLPVVVRIRDGPGQGDGRGDHGGRPRHDAVGVGQASGEGAVQGVGQPAVPAGGDRQRQRRDGGVLGVGLVGYRGRAEIRHHVVGIDVGDRDDQRGDGGGGHVAIQHVGDGDGVVDGIDVGRRGDRDGLGDVPVGHGEGQRAGEDQVTRGVDDGVDCHAAGGLGVQPHGVAGHVRFLHSEGCGTDEQAGPWCRDLRSGTSHGNHDRQGREAGVAQPDVRRHGRGHTKPVTGALASQDGDGARDAGRADVGPVDLDRHRGGLQNPRPNLAVRPPLEIHVQQERGTGVGMQPELLQSPQTVKQPLGQHAGQLV